MVLPYLDAMGSLDLACGTDAPALVATAVRELTRVWSGLRAPRAKDEAPLRIFVNHYPRSKLPGNCVAVEVIFYTVPDFWIAGDRAVAIDLHDPSTHENHV